jgi:hypothetical protein
VAKHVVHEKLENATANQQQPHFDQPSTGSPDKKNKKKKKQTNIVG